MVTVTELFSGIGGLGYGFAKAGFVIEAAVERNPARAEVYKNNIRPRRMLASDVRAVDLTKYRHVDVVIAGPPCRPYSLATPRFRRGTTHPEYGLDAEVVRAVDEVKPKAVVVEEVPAWDPRPLAKELRKLGYSVKYKLVAFSEYGVPTTRKRWILVALRGHVGNVFSALETLKEDYQKPIDLLRDLPPEPCGVDPCKVNGKIVYNHINSSINSKLKELIPLIPPGHSLVSAHKAGIIDASSYVQNIAKKHSYWLYRPPLDGLVKVVPHPRRSIMLHPVYNRMITVRELARLYTYPDDFDLRPLNLDEMYRAIADSVPPKFSIKLAMALKTVIESDKT
jgi:DNA (cytosine-5)-methyltransferase 1